MTAVIYARYSSDNQREESIEGQIRECTAYAEKNGFTVVKHYIDRAISAKTDNRPQFQQMIKDSERGIFDIIIVWKLDRFARNRYDSARYKTQLKRNGVKLVSATEVISAGPEGIILESVLEGYAEYYSADLSEKVVRSMTENALKGIYNGGTIPFGYMIDETRHYQPDPLLAPYVEQTFQKYADGATMTDLRDWLKAHNIKNSMGGEMSYNTIQRMLSNRRYIGELRLRDVVQPNAIPALVSEELFNKVQKKLAKNKKAPARHKAEESYLLTTKLYCGKCGALMFGESGVSHTGKMYTYYKCAAAKKKKTCDKKGRAETVAGRSGCQRDHETGGRRCFHECHHRQSDGAAKSGKHGFAHLRKAVEGNGSRHHQYAECHPDGHSDQFHQGAAGSAGRTAEGVASPHCRGTACQAEDERGVRPVLAASLPQAGYDPAGAAAGTGGYLHQCHLSLR